jgi:hypothetical protein
MPIKKFGGPEYYILHEIVNSSEFGALRTMHETAAIHEELSKASQSFNDIIKVKAKEGVVMEPISHSCFLMGDKLVVTLLIRRISIGN